MEQKLDPPLPGFLYPNIQERKAILIPDEGSSILVPLTTSHSLWGTSISRCETSLLGSGSMQPYCFKFFFCCCCFTVAIDNPYLLNKTFTSILMPGLCWNQKAGWDLAEPYSLLSANRSSLLCHVLLSHDQMTLVQSLSFLRDETEVLRG